MAIVMRHPEFEENNVCQDLQAVPKFCIITAEEDLDMFFEAVQVPEAKGAGASEIPVVELTAEQQKIFAQTVLDETDIATAAAEFISVDDDMYRHLRTFLKQGTPQWSLRSGVTMDPVPSVQRMRRSRGQ